MSKRKKLTVLSMADGIGTGHHVLNMLDVTHDYLAVEICLTKREIADHNAVIERPVHDIYELLAWLKNNVEVARKIDLILCGFTCTSLSSQECLRWQGIDFLDLSIVTKDQGYEAIGDGWQFNAVKLILGWEYEARA